MKLRKSDAGPMMCFSPHVKLDLLRSPEAAEKTGRPSLISGAVRDFLKHFFCVVDAPPALRHHVKQEGLHLDVFLWGSVPDTGTGARKAFFQGTISWGSELMAESLRCGTCGTPGQFIPKTRIRFLTS